VAREKVNDIDLFCDDKDYASEIATEMAGGEKERLMITGNAITIRRFKYAVQFITRWTFENPKDIISSFDYTICQAAFWWDHYCQKWCSIVSDDFYPDLAAKRLIYTEPIRNEAPGGSMLRVLKYYQSGYRITVDSLSRVITRIAAGVNYDELIVNYNTEELNTKQYQKIIRGLLHEVDPNIDPDHIVE